jgi:hypothetical protein
MRCDVAISECCPTLWNVGWFAYQQRDTFPHWEQSSYAGMNMRRSAIRASANYSVLKLFHPGTQVAL